MINDWQNLRDLLLSSASQHPDRTALWVDQCSISYRELIEHGHGIANAIEPTPSRTAVFANRHYWSYAGIVGAILAGHAYVPLNPTHPPERLLAMLRTADVSTLIIDRTALETCRGMIEQLDTLTVVVPDTTDLPDWTVGLPHQFRTGVLEHRVSTAILTPQSGAYLLFTSGSTGVPKGVMVNHGNVATYVRTMINRYGLTKRDRMSQLFELTFDLSVHDMFVCWGAGGTLYCPSDGSRRVPKRFVREHDLTCWFSTPSAVSLLVRMRLLHPGDFPSLRWSLFCGEALPKRLAAIWQTAAPNSIVENLYGPTEATIAITAYRLPADLTNLPDIIPIGTALPDQMAVVDNSSGELLLAGTQVTEGYWRRPDLTAERFVTISNHRWYRTGDRVVIGEHGLEFSGRLDRQIKVSGHRVELMEVEAKLRIAADCDSVAAIPHVDEDGVVYGIVALVAEESRPSHDIVAACRQTLAPYMVPARLIRVRDWPLNSSGKTDYRALILISENAHDNR